MSTAPARPTDPDDVIARAKALEAERRREARELRKHINTLEGRTSKAGHANAYDAQRAASLRHSQAASLAGRDIGDLPPIVAPSRRKDASSSLEAFCLSYFPHTFRLRFSPDHRKAIARIETCVRYGGLFALAMPRGSGKTTLCEVASIWSMLHGYRQFLLLIGASEPHATTMLESIKSELETNDLLLEDYPEACYPIRKLDGIVQRANGQLYRGERTHIEWSGDEIVLPTIPGSISSGAIIRVRGITGSIRGAKFKRADGGSVRPDLVIMDDPQTDESAHSAYQISRRLDVINKAVLNLAGPGKKIAAVMPCTVITPGDLADTLLDREKNPRWAGEKTKLIYEFPRNTKAWERYAEMLTRSLKTHSDLREATAYYRAHRDELDEGAIVAWEDRYNEDEASAIQHAMNLKLLNEASFYAEFQNEPLEQKLGSTSELTAEQIASKLHGLPRRMVPIGGSTLTAFIDVQQNLLYYLVAAWSDDFTGYVIDYGSWPDQRSRYFRLVDIQRKISDATGTQSLEGSIYAALDKLTDALLESPYLRDDGAEIKISRVLIDANWGSSTEVVYQFCRQSKHAAVLTPSHGRFVGASSQPFSEYTRKPGERIGDNWRMPTLKGKRTVRHVLFDANHWKSFVHSRLAVAIGDPGCLTLYGQNAQEHGMLADHLLAEYRIRTEGRGRTVDEWRPRPDNRDNHWLDCLAGSAVAASMCGCSLADVVRPVKPTNHERGKRISFAEMQRRKAGQ